MTKSEFLRNVPDIIEHKTWGYAELEIVADTEQSKGVCYRHKDNISSGGTWGSNWLEVYRKLTNYLKSEGYIKI